MKKINVENTVKERIDKYLSEVLDISRSEINRMINDKCLLLNGLYPKASSKVSDGDIISIVKEYKADTNIASEDMEKRDKVNSQMFLTYSSRGITRNNEAARKMVK